ncbi:MAG: hypothetical protein methR_P1491 [Methyloprofundus sp.]|nr:MAG: hypothetical protein methR_P1491 [Methyloprofundus sp.]
MQMNLVEIKELLADWYLLTLENPIYAGALVVSVWLLTVFFYSIRIFFLNKKQRKTEQQADELKSQLEGSQQQLGQTETTLATLNEQVASEQRQANEFTAKIEERNQDIVTKIKEVANKFDLSEQLVDSGEKAKPEFIWQQQDNIQMQLADRLQAEKQEKDALQRSYQQEKEQFIAKDAVIQTLQTTVDQHVQKFTQLEQDVAGHKQQVQQQEAVAESALADLTEKHKLELATVMTELEEHREVAELAKVSIEQPVVMEAPVIVEDALGDTEELLGKDAALVLKEEQQGQDFMNMGKPVEDASAPIESSIVVEEAIQPEPEIIAPEQSAEVLIVNDPIPEPVQEDISVEPEYEKSNLDILGKFKGLFGKSKKTATDTAPKKSEPEKTAEALVVEEPVLAEEPEASVAATPDYDKSKLDISGKFKGLFGKSKKVAIEVAPEISAEEVVVTEPVQEPEETISTAPDYEKSNLDISGKFKGLFGKSKKAEVVAEIENAAEVLTEAVAEAVVATEVVAEKTDSAITGKMKGMFGKSKKTAVVVEPVESAEILIVEELEVEEVVVEPDYGESNIKMPKVFKGLFGKK